MKKIKKVVYFIFMSLLLGGCANKSNGTSVKVYDTTDTLSGTLTYGALYICLLYTSPSPRDTR